MKKSIKIILISLVLIIIICISSCFIFVNPFLSIELIGDREIVIDVFDKYKEDGARAKIFGKDISNSVKMNSFLDINKIGKYKIEYVVKFLKTERKVNRVVKVVDSLAPVIELIGDSEVNIYVGENFSDPGVKANDLYDGDLTDKVKVDSLVDSNNIGNYSVNYEVVDSSNNKASISRVVNVLEKNKDFLSNNINTKQVNSKTSFSNYGSNGYGEVILGPTYINGILIVNKKYSLPSSFGNGVDNEAYNALLKLQEAASEAGFNIPLISGYRSYSRQDTLYNNYVRKDGVFLADTYSARPGHSEHQTGLAFDVGAIDDNYGDTEAGRWLSSYCHEFGFIIRYLKGKEDITGFKYEPWHIRYVGVEHASSIAKQKITLEEYLGVN